MAKLFELTKDFLEAKEMLYKGGFLYGFKKNAKSE